MARMFDPRFERRKTGAQAHFGLEIRVLLNLPQLVVFLLGQLDASRWWHSPIISLRYLVEEVYGVRPPGEYMQYNNEELKIAYTKEAEQSLRGLEEQFSKRMVPWLRRAGC